MSYLNYDNKALVNKARSLRKSMTKAEILLWSRLRCRQINGLKFRRQQPVLQFIADFYCNSLKLIIEVDGNIHDDQNLKEKDIEREKILKEHGFKILRFENDEVEFEMSSVIGKICSFLRENYPEFTSSELTINEKKHSIW